MARLLSISLIPCLLSALSGCKDINANPRPGTGRFDGRWQVEGRSVAKLNDVEGNCKYALANGTIDIEGRSVTGSLMDSNGYAYELEGHVTDRGEISGAFTYEGYDAATYSGRISSADGRGDWQDVYGCPGTWRIARLAGTKPKDHADREVPSAL